MVRYLKGCPVKNAQWKRLLEAKAEQLNVNLVFHLSPFHYEEDNACMRVPNMEVWECERPSVEIGCLYSEPDNELMVNTVLHEYGHVLDLRRFRNSMMDLIRKLGVLGMEVSAWENAFQLAKEIEYFNYELMEKDALECLEGYFFYTGEHKPDGIANFKGTPPTWEEAQARVKAARKKAEEELV